MPRLKQALEHAVRIAETLGHRVPSTEHMLAGLVTVPGALAVEILRQARGRPADVGSELADRLGVEPERLVVTRRRRRRLLAKA
jgi:ATP-dependent Clp protease ATP-binding subunit ClpA